MTRLQEHDGSDGSVVPEHAPVMLNEALRMLNVRPGGHYLDATVGLGGHAAAILEAAAPAGRLLGTDADPAALQVAATRLVRFSTHVVLRQAWLDQAPDRARAEGLAPLDGILCDLGLSSLQLDTPARGFSFQREGPLDMRFGPGDGQSDDEITADEIVNHWTQDDLANLIYEYGEDRRSRRIARAIVERRPVHTTTELAAAVVAAVGRRPGTRIHPATRVFQALRLAVNRELERLDDFLAQSRSILRRGGRLVVIAFHSLEDRVVKRFLQAAASASSPEYRLLSRRVLRPSADEVSRNPRARSARLRAAEAV